MSRLKGKDLMLAIGTTSTVIGASTECSFHCSCDIEEITSALSGMGKCFIPGRYEFDLRASALMETGTTGSQRTLLGYLIAGTSFTAYFGLDNTNFRLSGTVIVQDWTAGAPVDGNATYNVVLKGTGNLSLL